MSPARPRALIITAELERAKQLGELLEQKGLDLGMAKDRAEALGMLEITPVQMLFVEVAGLGPSPDGALAKLRDHSAAVRTILIADNDQLGTALDAIKSELAHDYVRLPLNAHEVAFAVDKADCEVVASDDSPPASGLVTGLIGESKTMRQLRWVLQRAAPGNATVLIRGESGTGKELVARAIHTGSRRAAGPFVKVQCSALPDALLESELFGYDRGAFTGAVGARPGRVEVAEGGSLFLDEIGDITPAIQVKLLRLLQDRQYERLGSNRTNTADVRFIAATHRDLEGMVRRQEFREDLFYRLNVVPIWLPPLRARRSDVPLLAKHFCRAFAEINGRPNLALTESALIALGRRRWPGNVRQLQNFIERLVVMASKDLIDADDVNREMNEQVTFATQATSVSTPQSVRQSLQTSREQTPPPSEAAPRSTTLQDSSSSRVPPTARANQLPPTPVRTLSEEVSAAERRALLRALEQTGGNRAAAARILGVSRATLYNKLEEHQLR